MPENSRECQTGDFCRFSPANALRFSKNRRIYRAVAKNHQKIDFFSALANADITAHIDFLALDKIVRNFELESSLVAQEEFLLNLGAQERVDFLIQKNPHLAQEILTGFAKLIDKNQMGILFKSHIFWKK